MFLYRICLLIILYCLLKLTLLPLHNTNIVQCISHTTMLLSIDLLIQISTLLVVLLSLIKTIHITHHSTQTNQYIRLTLLLRTLASILQCQLIMSPSMLHQIQLLICICQIYLPLHQVLCTHVLLVLPCLQAIHIHLLIRLLPRLLLQYHIQLLKLNPFRIILLQHPHQQLFEHTLHLQSTHVLNLNLNLFTVNTRNQLLHQQHRDAQRVHVRLVRVIRQMLFTNEESPLLILLQITKIVYLRSPISRATTNSVHHVLR